MIHELNEQMKHALMQWKNCSTILYKPTIDFNIEFYKEKKKKPNFEKPNFKK